MATIIKRETKKGVRWDAQVYFGRDPDTGKAQFARRSFPRKRDADQWAAGAESMRGKGELTKPPSKDAFVTYLKHWLEVKGGEVRARTLHDYKGIVRRWIEKPPPGAPALGTIRLDHLTATAFEKLYAWMREQGKSPRTIRYVHVVLRQALKDAARKNEIPRNPTDFAKVPTRAKDAEGDEAPKVRAMDKDQAAAFLEAARADRYHALWTVLLTGGLRPSEAFALKWPDIDFETGRVHVARSLTRTGVEGWRLVPTKTKRSRRAVPLPQLATDALREWRTVQKRERLALGPEYRHEGFVFTTPLGTPLDLSNLYAWHFRRVMERAKLGEWGPEPVRKTGQRGPQARRPFKPAFRLYDLRHTCATLLLRAGVPVKVVSERLGHASIVLTSDTYSHVLPDMQDGAAAAMQDMFPAATGTA